MCVVVCVCVCVCVCDGYPSMRPAPLIGGVPMKEQMDIIMRFVGCVCVCELVYVYVYI